MCWGTLKLDGQRPEIGRRQSLKQRSARRKVQASPGRHRQARRDDPAHGQRPADLGPAAKQGPDHPRAHDQEGKLQSQRGMNDGGQSEYIAARHQPSSGRLTTAARASQPGTAPGAGPEQSPRRDDSSRCCRLGHQHRERWPPIRPGVRTRARPGCPRQSFNPGKLPETSTRTRPAARRPTPAVRLPRPGQAASRDAG